MASSHSLAGRYIRVPDTLDTRGIDYELPAFKEADRAELAGQRVLFMSADGPELPEIFVPMDYLTKRGAVVKLAGQNWIFEYRDPPGHIVIAQWLADNITCSPIQSMSFLPERCSSGDSFNTQIAFLNKINGAMFPQINCTFRRPFRPPLNTVLLRADSNPH